MPKISIVLPSYNRAHYLPGAIESCLKQSFKDFELIIVDDCSKDDSVEIARGYAKLDKRVKLIVNAENKKLPGTLNAGFGEAKGEYLTWTSDDNLYHFDALRIMREALDSMQDVGLVYTDYSLIDDAGNNGKRIYQEPPEFLPVRDCVGACFMYRADVARKIGEYNEDMFLMEDYEYWLRMGLVTKLHHIAEALYFYRLHSQSLTQRRAEEIRKAKNCLKELYQDKYVIPEYIKPINALYMWFIGDRSLESYVKLLGVILTHPLSTIGYIVKNLRRWNLRDIVLRGK